MVADICNAPVLMYRQEEGAAFGAALQALSITGDLELRALVREHLDEDPGRSCRPEPVATAFYNEAYEEYQRAAAQVADYYET